MVNKEILVADGFFSSIVLGVSHNGFEPSRPARMGLAAANGSKSQSSGNTLVEPD